MMESIALLLIAFQLKHFVADYLFQTEYMLGKFKEKGWALPLASHCLVHAACTIIIALSFGVSLGVALFITAFDFVLHFIMDRIKASPNMLGVFTTKEKAFWVSLGFDQMFHHLTHYFLIFLIYIEIT